MSEQLQTNKVLPMACLAVLPLIGCASLAKRDLAHDPFPEAQTEIRAVLETIIHDAETANVDGLREVHLESDKFTKFGGGEVYERMNYAECVESEAAAVTSVQEYRSEAKDLKIDVFGNVAVVTYYPYRVVKKDGKVLRYSARQSLVFLKTRNGWRIVHEHQSPKRYDLSNYPFPEGQEELRLVLEKIYHDARTAELAALRAGHLNSAKFTKFGPRSFERQNFQQCNETEADFVTSIQDAEFDLQDIKIDVFGDVAIATYYPQASFKKDGEVIQASGRQTLVFLNTADGWKIVHEHGTPKACFAEAQPGAVEEN